jgi:hypothetical protein
MKIGKKTQGHVGHGKLCVAHHTSRMRHGKGRRIEKAIETKVRHEGQRICKDHDV